MSMNLGDVKKTFILILICMLLISGCGTASTATTVASATPKAAGTVVVTPATTVASIPSPKPTPVDPTAEKLALAPDIDGLTKAIEGKDGIQKVIYRYTADNPYGGKAGEYAGEFKKEVTEKDPDTGEVKEIGGVVLEPKAVVFRLNEKYETLDPNYVHDRPLYGNAMMIPLDISTMSDSSIQISYIPTKVEGSKTGIVVVGIGNGPLPVVCPGKGLNDYSVREERGSVWFRLKNNFPSNFCVTQEGGLDYDAAIENMTKYIDLIGDFILDEDKEIINKVSFGQEIVQVESYLKFGFFRNTLSDAVTENMLRVDNCLVFMKTN